MENTEKRKSSYEKIEEEEKEAENKQDGGAVDAAARKARDGAQEGTGDGLEAGLFADGVERAGRRVAGEIAAEKGEFIVEPHGEIAAAAPHERGTGHEQQITENRQEPERRACSPIHKSSQAAYTIKE